MTVGNGQWAVGSKQPTANSRQPTARCAAVTLRRCEKGCPCVVAEPAGSWPMAVHSLSLLNSPGNKGFSFKLIKMSEVTRNIENFPFLKNTGEIGDLVISHAWEKTSLGPIEEWPLSLRITLYDVLHSGFPMFLFWGEEFLCFYNNAFRPSLGAEGKHPAIGKKAIVVWGEIWDIIGPLLQKVFVTGESVMFEDRLVPFYRDGKVEDIYWTFTYSPALGEDDKISGVLVTCFETTRHVMGRNNGQ